MTEQEIIKAVALAAVGIILCIGIGYKFWHVIRRKMGDGGR
jgi:hypothetical protein